jgi:ATP-dependent RNA helicase DDX56/DBP9
MKHVPKYLMPNVAAAAATPVAGTGNPDGITFVPFSKGRGRGNGRGRGKFSGGGGRVGKKKKNDPLKKFR